jgi:transcriptional regulator with XRE-family HTH domain
VISTLIKNIMMAQGLTQKETADLLNTSIDRIKSLASGRTKNFTIEESQILVRELGIRAEWLITGEGDMFVENELPENLSIDENMLLSAYRNASFSEKKKILQHAMLDKKAIVDGAVNQSNNTISGQQIGSNNEQTNKFNNGSSFDQNIQGDVKIKSKGKRSQAAFNISNNEK